MIFEKAPDIQKRIIFLARKLFLEHIEPEKVIGFRSFGSKSRAQARIWSFPKIWQKALGLSPYYCVEVLAEKFDRLSIDEQTKVLIHELLHIPKNFSGALLPHRGRGRQIDRREVERLFKMVRG